MEQRIQVNFGYIIYDFKVIKKERGLKRKRKEQNETKRETK